ncbi:MAG: TOBE domain-containing protein [Caldilineaceae bacterium]
MAQRIAVMNFGALQQVGSFDEIYNHPVNEFVAGFIGEPPMNFLACRPVANNGGMELVAEDNSFKVSLPAELATNVTSKKPEKVNLGVRPIHISVERTGTANALELPATVQTYESLGEEGQLAAQVGKSQVLVVTPPGLALKRGNNITLHMRTDRIHLFDGQSGNAL